MILPLIALLVAERPCFEPYQTGPRGIDYASLDGQHTRAPWALRLANVRAECLYRRVVQIRAIDQR